MTNDVCKLTGKNGKFVRAHIIPAALTPPEVKGDPLRQAGMGRPATKRWSSWYDPKLVTAEGEAILRDLDTWAIEELRRHKLIWSSWGAAAELQAPDHQMVPIPDAEWGFRKVTIRDPNKLRVFFLSLLWRAAASTLADLDEVQLDEGELRQLRQMILAGSAAPMTFYPIQLLQLPTRGKPHNLTPFRRTVTEPDPVNGGQTPPYEVIRFYFDGLTASFDCRTFTPEQVAARGNIHVGYAPDLNLGTVAFEKSFQRENLKRLMLDDLRQSLGEGNRTQRRKAKAMARTKR